MSSQQKSKAAASESESTSSQPRDPSSDQGSRPYHNNSAASIGRGPEVQVPHQVQQLNQLILTHRVHRGRTSRGSLSRARGDNNNSGSFEPSTRGGEGGAAGVPLSAPPPSPPLTAFAQDVTLDVSATETGAAASAEGGAAPVDASASHTPRASASPHQGARPVNSSEGESLRKKFLIKFICEPQIQELAVVAQRIVDFENFRETSSGESEGNNQSSSSTAGETADDGKLPTADSATTGGAAESARASPGYFSFNNRLGDSTPSRQAHTIKTGNRNNNRSHSRTMTGSSDNPSGQWGGGGTGASGNASGNAVNRNTSGGQTSNNINNSNNAAGGPAPSAAVASVAAAALGGSLNPGQQVLASAAAAYFRNSTVPLPVGAINDPRFLQQFAYHRQNFRQQQQAFQQHQQQQQQQNQQQQQVKVNAAAFAAALRQRSAVGGAVAAAAARERTRSIATVQQVAKTVAQQKQQQQQQHHQQQRSSHSSSVGMPNRMTSPGGSPANSAKNNGGGGNCSSRGATPLTNSNINTNNNNTSIQNLLGINDGSRAYILREQALQRCAETNPLLYERLHALEVERRLVNNKYNNRTGEEKDATSSRSRGDGAGGEGGPNSRNNSGMGGEERDDEQRGQDVVVDYGRNGTGDAEDVISILDSDEEQQLEEEPMNDNDRESSNEGATVYEPDLVGDDNGRNATLQSKKGRLVGTSTAAFSAIANDVTGGILDPSSLPNPLEMTNAAAGSSSSKTETTSFTLLRQVDGSRQTSGVSMARASGAATNENDQSHSGPKFFHEYPPHASLLNSQGKRKSPEASANTSNNISSQLTLTKRAKYGNSLSPAGATAEGASTSQLSSPQMALPVALLGNQSAAFAAAAIAASTSESSEKAAAALADIRIDPTFVQMIVAVSKESISGNNAQMTREMKKNPLLGTFSRGLLNMDDEMLKQGLDDRNDQSNKMCISSIIAPGLGIPSNIFNNNEGRWEGYVHVSSDHVIQFSKNIVYQRRKSMKSAVEIACDEMKKKHFFLMHEQKKADQLTIDSQNERIKELEEQLKTERQSHKKQMQALEELHLADTEECDREQREFLENMLKAHARELKTLKEEVARAQAGNSEVLNIYMDATCDTLRMLQKDRKPDH